MERSAPGWPPAAQSGPSSAAEPFQGQAPAAAQQARPGALPQPQNTAQGAPRPMSLRVVSPPGPATGPSGGPERQAAASGLRRLTASASVRQAVLLIAYLAAGVAVTWPRATYLTGRLPALRDDGGYVWDFWWVARQLSHFRDPWFTNHLAAPVGSWLGFHTMMPLPTVLFMPVTLTFGPSVSYNLLSILCPGLLCYAMYRTARLWLRSAAGAIAAGAFFGLSTELAWQSWYQVNLAAGALFFPLTLAAAVRLRRRPGGWQAVTLGLVLAGALFTDQESAVMSALLAALTLLPWLAVPLPRPGQLWHRSGLTGLAADSQELVARLTLAATAAGTALLLALPQLMAMAQQGPSANAASYQQVVAGDYVGSGAGVQQLFAPSPRVASFGLHGLAGLYYRGGPHYLVIIGYGLVLSVLAVAGLVIARRQRSAWLLAMLWAACSLLALGTAPWFGGRRHLLFTQVWHGVRVSTLMPFTWLVQLPGLANFREADRFTELGLVGAALLAGAAVSWLSAHRRPLVVVVAVLAALEAGWSGNPPGRSHIGVMPTALPAVDGPIAADRSGSLVVDVPFGIRGGLPVVGRAFPPEALVLATADGHPRGEAFISRIPMRVRKGIRAIPFYQGLLWAQDSLSVDTPDALRLASLSARQLRIGWVLDWEHRNPAVTSFLHGTGFRIAYRADGVAVYRPVTAVSRLARWRHTADRRAAARVSRVRPRARSRALRSVRPSAHHRGACPVTGQALD